MLKTIWEKIKWVFGDEQAATPAPAPAPVVEENCQCGKAEKVKAAKQRKPRTKTGIEPIITIQPNLLSSFSAWLRLLFRSRLKRTQLLMMDMISTRK